MQRIMVCRHIETNKNLLDIHGGSDLVEVTDVGKRQLERLAKRCVCLGDFPAGVVATPTAQAVMTAKLLAERLGVPYDGTLELLPYNMGIASGVSTAQLRTLSPRSHYSIDQFRNRLVAATDLEIQDAETAEDIEKRLLAWWGQEGQTSVRGRVIVGSNSTVLMLSHFFNGILPTSDRYRYRATPNGTARVWEVDDSWEFHSATPISVREWPDKEAVNIATSRGNIHTIVYWPGWDKQDAILVFAPGIAGNATGEFNFHHRLGKHVAPLGFRTLAFDAFGSGASSAVIRDFDADVLGLLAVAKWASSGCNNVFFVGHMTGAAAALAAARAYGPLARSLCFAPVGTKSGFDHLLAADQGARLALASLSSSGEKMIADMFSTWSLLKESAAAVFTAEKDERNQMADLPSGGFAQIRPIVNCDCSFASPDGDRAVLQAIEEFLLT